jgi:hypothetical protein
MAYITSFYRANLEERRVCLFCVHDMARGTVHGRFSMGACKISGIGLGVTCQAFVSFCVRNVCGFKSKDVCSPSFFEVRLSITMACRAALVYATRLGHKCFGQVFMTINASIDIRFLSNRFGSG